ncbi:hypothetical protein TNCV_2207371 [Trichonephila clavipes]|uniref:Uncharacterized protein n=1 Tax=Trichonephila clavipes TaxID=2585209 RepID=A0A8X6S2L5_TRICX|nr:hypothetical protein TNCV_2207371 [Trichonephila clavipes]
MMFDISCSIGSLDEHFPTILVIRGEQNSRMGPLYSSLMPEAKHMLRIPRLETILQNQRIPWSQHTKYLGVIIDKALTFGQHIA